MAKVAIIRRNGLGDLLCAFPLVRYFQREHPETRLTLFVDERNALLLPYLPPVDEVVVFPQKGNKYLSHYRIARKYRHQFDAAYSAKTSPMKLMNLFLYWLRAKKRYAYVDQSWHSRFVNCPLPFDEKSAKGAHQTLKTLQMVAPELEEVPEELYPALTLPDEMRTPPSGLKLLLSASTTREASRLSVERYAELVNRLFATAPFEVEILSMPADRERAEALERLIEAPSQIHFPRTFEAFMVLLDQCALYFVGDGGVAHIGAALGKHQVVLYGQTNPIEWRPLSRQVETFYHPTHVEQLSDQSLLHALQRKLEVVNGNDL